MSAVDLDPQGVRAVAFLGLGLMGRPMAEHLAVAGVPLRVWNRTARTAASFARFPNVAVCAQACTAVKSAQIVIVMLSTGQVVDEVLFAADSTGARVADALEPSSLVIVMSSIPVETAQSQAQRLRGLGVGYIDAPVSGGQSGAQAASLTIMAGGDPSDIDSALPIMSRFGRVTRVGPVGSGQLAKLANQLIVGVTIGAVAEALLLARAGGADVGLVQTALLGGFADSRILREHGRRMVERSFQPGARVATQLKDLATARGVADRHDLHLPFLSLAEKLYGAMCDQGLDGLDHSALYMALEKEPGTDA